MCFKRAVVRLKSLESDRRSVSVSTLNYLAREGYQMGLYLWRRFTSSIFKCPTLLLWYYYVVVDFMPIFPSLDPPQTRKISNKKHYEVTVFHH